MGSDPTADPISGTLLLCGSTSEVSLGQIRAYRAAHPGVPSEMLTAQEKDPRFWQTEAGLSRLAGWRERLQTDALVMVQSVRDRRAQDSDVTPAMVAAAFGRIAKQLLAAVPNLTLVVFGGDTLFGIMSAMPGSSLCPVAEMVPGLVVNRLTSNTGTCLLVSKAGGFGAPDVLETVMAHVAAYKQ
jgi:4-hydroxythreonine-4-phosphate dehydrogenase